MDQRILVIDNYDSFVYTLVGYLEQLGQTLLVVRNDALDSSALASSIDESRAVLVSPGPGSPDESGLSLEAVGVCLAKNKPYLGVCLGHQALAQKLGARVDQTPYPVHGKTSEIFHEGTELFRGLPSPFLATRYHSLVVQRDSLPRDLRVTAQTASGVVMALEHVEAPLYGVQFHPESVLTDYGHRLLANWLELAGVCGAARRALGLSPRFKT